MPLVHSLGHLSKHQKKILENLTIKPDMTAKELAEMIFGRIVDYRTKEYASVYRSLISLERQGFIQRVHVQLKWRRIEKKDLSEKH
jgi:Fe2+ or Zn2+ uptake regulation protein